MAYKAKRGILLIALGDPMYGRMAANLITSIRFSDKDIPVHLVYSGNSISHLSESRKAMFTSISECPPEYYSKNGKVCYFKAKTHVYDLSPFEETIFMDVDLLLFGGKKPSDWFEQLKDIDFTMQNRGYADLTKENLKADYCMWVNIQELKAMYPKSERFYQLASEFIYFKRTDNNALFFEYVKEIYMTPPLKSMQFGTDLPDEYAYDIACATLQHYPHKDNFVMIYWYHTEPKMPMNDIIKKYSGYSIGGNYMPDHVKASYDNMAKFYAKASGERFHYTIMNKRQFAPERKAI